MLLRMFLRALTLNHAHFLPTFCVAPKTTLSSMASSHLKGLLKITQFIIFGPAVN